RTCPVSPRRAASPWNARLRSVRRIRPSGDWLQRRDLTQPGSGRGPVDLVHEFLRSSDDLAVACQTGTRTAPTRAPGAAQPAARGRAPVLRIVLLPALRPAARLPVVKSRSTGHS